MATALWSEHFTKEGRVYYYNRSTKQSSWEKPGDFDGESSGGNADGSNSSSAKSTSAATTAAAARTTTPNSESSQKKSDIVEWEELWDPKNERAYYYNRATRKTQWLRPENVPIKPYGGTAASTASASSSAKKAESKKADKRSDDTTATAAGTTDDATAAKTSSSTPSAKKRRESDDATARQRNSDKRESDATLTHSAATAASGTTDTAATTADAASANQHDEAAAAAAGRKRKKARSSRKDSSGGTGASDSTNGSARSKKKHVRSSSNERRLIICDDDDNDTNNNGVDTPRSSRRALAANNDTEDGKEATRLLQQLSAPDAIMERNVLVAINGFLRAHNDANGPEILVEALSTSYRGHAQMVGLVATWLDALPATASALETKVAYDAADNALHHASKDKGASWDRADAILYQHLTDVVAQHYEPKLVSNVLSGSAAEPEWLTQMLGARKWRLMLIELAETHKTCNLLQYAIRRISEAGHHKEIASITNANAFFTVFSGVLVDAFCRIPFASEEEAREDVAALTKICCQSAYSYLYAEELLCTLDSKLFALETEVDARSAEGLRLRTARSKLSRVRFELQDTAIGRFGAKVGFFHPLRRRYVVDANPRLSDAVLSIMTTRKCSESAAETLVKEYKVAKTAPPAAHLRDPIVLRSLIDPLFNPSESIASHFAENCITLLAYAASTKDERSVLQLSDATHQVEIDVDGMQATKAALADASAICRSDNTLGYNMNQSGVVERLTTAMRVPVVAMGVLHWLEVILQSPAFVNSTLLHICFPSLLVVLKASIQLHTAQWPIAFHVLVTSLRLHPEINPVKALELKRESLRTMVFMVTSGYVLPVLEFVLLNTAELDQALLRNFVTMLFARVAPPFSAPFVVALSKILTHPKVQNAVTSCPLEFKTKLAGFVAYCRKHPAMLPAEQLQTLVLMHEKRDS